jgi:peptide methionine sulfoxide reductase MsrA
VIIETSLRGLQERTEKPVVVECKPLENFWPAEEYHQKYLEKNPNGYCHIPRSLFKEAETASDEATLKPARRPARKNDAGRNYTQAPR